MKVMVHPVRDKAEYDAAIARIDEIFMRAEPNTPEGDELEILTILVNVYAKEHFPIDPPTAIEALKSRLDHGHFTRKDLDSVLGSSAKTTEILNGARTLSKQMIVNLHARFGIPYDILLSETPVRAVRGKKFVAVKRTAAKSVKKAEPRSARGKARHAS
jgi:HTH-type transcriptional regulator/antitoxin HigA